MLLLYLPMKLLGLERAECWNECYCLLSMTEINVNADSFSIVSKYVGLSYCWGEYSSLFRQRLEIILTKSLIL